MLFAWTCLVVALTISHSGAVHSNEINDVSCQVDKVDKVVCSDAEVECGEQCVARAFTERFEDAELKFEAYVKKISGKDEITVADIGMSDVGDGNVRHELWVLKFLWLKARWGGVCEKAAFHRASEVGMSQRSEADSTLLVEILKVTAALNPTLAKIAAAKVPLDENVEATAFQKLEQAIASGHVSAGRRKNKFKGTAQLGDVLLHQVVEEEKDIKVEIEAIPDEHEKELVRNRRATLLAQSAETELNEKASAWSGAGENPYQRLQSAVKITNEYMDLTYTSSGYGQHGIQKHSERTGAKEKVFVDVGVPELPQFSTFEAWLKFYTTSSACKIPFSIDAGNRKPDTLPVDNQRMKNIVTKEHGMLLLLGPNPSSVVSGILGEKNLPSVYEVEKTLDPWWTPANKQKYYHLIWEVEKAYPKSVPKC